jgi:threonine/homoserine/homoserine lactone efflux protein
MVQREPAGDTSSIVGNLVAFVAVSAVVICTPGQDTALTIRNTLTGGRSAGLATAGGVALGQAVWTLAASVGLVAVLSASEPAFRALKLAGAAYLVYLGLHSLRSAFAGRARTGGSTPRMKLMPGRALRQGVVSNLGNPKMAVFFASLLPQFAPGGSASFVALFALGILFCSLTLGWLALYAVVVARTRSFLRGHVRRALDAATGVVLVLFGIRLATDSR